MKPVLTDKQLLMRHIKECDPDYCEDTEPLNDVQFNYLVYRGFLREDGSLTLKGLDLAYGESRKTNSTALQN